jgi:hypothetical protein
MLGRCKESEIDYIRDRIFGMLLTRNLGGEMDFLVLGSSENSKRSFVSSFKWKKTRREDFKRRFGEVKSVTLVQLVEIDAPTILCHVEKQCPTKSGTSK